MYSASKLRLFGHHFGVFGRQFRVFGWFVYSATGSGVFGETDKTCSVFLCFGFVYSANAAVYSAHVG